MKFKLLSLVLLLLLGFSNYTFAQVSDSLQYRVVYDFIYQPDSTDINSKSTEEMWLLSGKKSSLFLSKALAIKDSLPQLTMADMGSERMEEYTAKTKTNFDFKILKNREAQELYFALKIMDDKLFYPQALTTINWQIQAEKKEISGYMVHKATTSFAGRDYIAWFTSEIPIPDGPYKFAGLPGLILALADTREHYIFEFKGFEKLANPILLELPPAEHQKSSKKRLLGLKQRYEEDPISYINNYVGAGGKKVTVKLIGEDKKDYLRGRKAVLAKKNNPIELQK